MRHAEKIYQFTNESLPGIIAGLKPKLIERRSALSILGSGDQSLAFLEYGLRLRSVDHHAKQIRSFFGTLETLKKGDFQRFRFEDENQSMSPLLADRNAYFTDERLERIRQNLGNLEVELEDIRGPGNETLSRRYDLCYLSNAFSFMLSTSFILSWENLDAASQISSTLLPGGLLYSADGFKEKGLWGNVSGLFPDVKLIVK